LLTLGAHADGDSHSDRAARGNSGVAGRFPNSAFSDPRENYRPDSDLDVLHHVEMEEDLGGIVARKVDLVSQRAIEQSSNWMRREVILESAER
jgi:hypothetical protein